MDFIEIGWREALLLAVAAVAVYLVVALLGLARLKRRHDADIREADIREADASAGTAFAPHLALRELETEVGRLRADVAALRQEVGELRNARTLPGVSPLYAEAAALAGRGFNARGVAEECGISVAEAELVLAMSREDKAFDKEDDHDGIGYPAVAEPAGR